MIKYLINRKLNSMSRRYDYDIRYMQEILESDFGAFLKYMAFQSMSSHEGGLPLEIVYAVRLSAIMWDDCGSCAQLVADMALEAKISPRTIRAIVNKDVNDLAKSTILVIKFTELVLSHSPEADVIREEIESLWGIRGVIAIGFCISTSRVYPALKYAMGYGKACKPIQLHDSPIKPNIEASSTGSEFDHEQ